MRGSPRTKCAWRTTPIYVWRKQATVEWSRRVISIVACWHSVKLCALAARAFRSQHCLTMSCAISLFAMQRILRDQFSCNWQICHAFVISYFICESSIFLSWNLVLFRNNTVATLEWNYQSRGCRQVKDGVIGLVEKCCCCLWAMVLTFCCVHHLTEVTTFRNFALVCSTVFSVTNRASFHTKAFVID